MSSNNQSSKRRGRPPKETVGPVELPDYQPGLTTEAQMQMLSEAAFKVAYEQLRSGKIAPSTLNKLLDYGTPQNDLKMQNLESTNVLVKSKVDQIKADNDEKVGHVEVLNEIKGYRGGTFDEREVADFI